MFRLRFTIDCQPRTKNGHPPQRITGVLRVSSTQVQIRWEAIFCSGCPGIISPIAAINTGIVRTRLARKRRFMSTSSGFGSSSDEIVLGSRAMPQIGQFPGSLRTISGCIGHTNWVRAAAGGATGSRVIPHFGHTPGPCCRTSGCIGHVYSPCAVTAYNSTANVACVGGSLSS